MSEPAINSSSVSQGDWRTVTMTDKSDWNAMYYVALGGDGHIHAPDDGWPEGVTIALTDAPYAALTCAPDEVQIALCSNEALAVAWDDFKLEPWVGMMVLQAGKRLRCRSERPIKMRFSYGDRLTTFGFGGAT